MGKTISRYSDVWLWSGKVVRCLVTGFIGTVKAVKHGMALVVGDGTAEIVSVEMLSEVL